MPERERGRRMIHAGTALCSWLPPCYSGWWVAQRERRLAAYGCRCWGHSIGKPPPPSRSKAGSHLAFPMQLQVSPEIMLDYAYVHLCACGAPAGHDILGRPTSPTPKASSNKKMKVGMPVMREGSTYIGRKASRLNKPVGCGVVAEFGELKRTLKVSLQRSL